MVIDIIGIHLIKSFKIPANCNHLKISAKLENGVLQVILPKKKIPKPRTIKVS